MLYIYDNINDFEEFCCSKYKEIFLERKTFENILIDYNVFILNKDKYTVDDVNDYIEFFMYKTTNNKRLAIINNFENIQYKIQNKLLKTFEEIEETQIIITNNKKKIINTIKSRALISEYKNDNLKWFNNQNNDDQNILLKLVTKEEDYNEIKNNDELILNILKLNKLLKQKEYDKLFVEYTLLSELIPIQVMYELIQNGLLNNDCNKIEELLNLQEKLNSNANKKLQIESFLVNLIESE